MVDWKLKYLKYKKKYLDFNKKIKGGATTTLLTSAEDNITELIKNIYTIINPFGREIAQGGSSIIYEDAHNPEKLYKVLKPEIIENIRGHPETFLLNEVISNNIYRFFGLNVPELSLKKIGSQYSIHMNKLTGLENECPFGYWYTDAPKSVFCESIHSSGCPIGLEKEYSKGFFVDCLLANNDVINIDGANIFLNNEKKFYRIDTGGSMTYSGLGDRFKSIYSTDAVNFSNIPNNHIALFKFGLHLLSTNKSHPRVLSSIQVDFKTSLTYMLSYNVNFYKYIDQLKIKILEINVSRETKEHLISSLDILKKRFAYYLFKSNEIILETISARDNFLRECKQRNVEKIVSEIVSNTIIDKYLS